MTSEVVLTPFSEVELQATEWLSDGRIPLGELTLVVGREGAGKSTFAYDTAGRASNGDLRGKFRGKKRGVIVVATEDNYSKTVKPRLLAAGADLKRVYHAKVISTETRSGELSLPDDLNSLAERIIETKTALVLLDPLMSRLSVTLDSHKDSEVRLALEPLVRLANDTEVAMMGIIHLNKAAGFDVMNRVMGSRAFGAVARCVHLVATAPDGTRYFAHAKNNLGPLATTLTFSVTDTKVGVDPRTGADVRTGRLDWTGFSNLDKDAVLALCEGGPTKTTKAEDAEGWLKMFLNDRAPTPKAVVIAAGIERGFSKATLDRAAKAVGVVSHRTEEQNAPAIWSLTST